MDKTSVKIKQMDENGTTTQELNDTFKRELFEKYGQKHTINKKTFKKKQRLYKQAKRTNKWNNYKHFQKEIKKQIRKAEWIYI